MKEDENMEWILCPDCGTRLVFEGGCPFCPAYGWSRC